MLKVLSASPSHNSKSDQDQVVLRQETALSQPTQQFPVFCNTKAHTHLLVLNGHGRKESRTEEDACLYGQE